MGRTTIVLDDRLVERAMKVSGATTKRQAVDIALRRMVDQGSAHQALRRLRGKLPWEGDVARWRRGR